MIVADTDHHVLPPIDAAEYAPLRTPGRFLAHDEPVNLPPQTFTLRRSILAIEPGRLLLRLTEEPKVLVDPDGRNCEVVGWGVRLPTANAEDIPAAMARRFLELFSNADTGTLNEDEQATWVDILDRVDFQSFSIDRALPHYMEGEITSSQPAFVRIRWHDGTAEKILAPVHRSLAHLRQGDHFGAHVKLGHENRTMGIENVVILNDREFIETQ